MCASCTQQSFYLIPLLFLESHRTEQWVKQLSLCTVTSALIDTCWQKKNTCNLFHVKLNLLCFDITYIVRNLGFVLRFYTCELWNNLHIYSLPNLPLWTWAFFHQPRISSNTRNQSIAKARLIVSMSYSELMENSSLRETGVALCMLRLHSISFLAQVKSFVLKQRCSYFARLHHLLDIDMCCAH